MERPSDARGEAGVERNSDDLNVPASDDIGDDCPDGVKVPAKDDIEGECNGLSERLDNAACELVNEGEVAARLNGVRGRRLSLVLTRLGCLGSSGCKGSCALITIVGPDGRHSCPAQIGAPGEFDRLSECLLDGTGPENESCKVDNRSLFGTDRPWSG